MAIWQKMNWYNLLRLLVSAWWLGILAWVAVADYPTDTWIYQLPMEGNAYYLWEVFMIGLAWWLSLEAIDRREAKRRPKRILKIVSHASDRETITRPP